MAVLIVSAAGAAIGSSLGLGIAALGLSGAAVGWTLGSIVGQSLFSETQKSYGPRLGDLRTVGTEYGQVIPYVVASPRIAGQIVWASDKRELATTTEVGKGGGGSEYTSYSYDVDLLILLTENPISGVSRIWSNGELVYGQDVAKEGVWDRLSVYTGGDNQLPDPTYEAAVGTANAPAYRGMGSVFIEGLKLGSSGTIPNLTFEVGPNYRFQNTQGTPSYLIDFSSVASVYSNNLISLYGDKLYIAGPSDTSLTNRYVVNLSDGTYSFLGQVDHGHNSQTSPTSYGYGIDDTIIVSTGTLNGGIRVSIGGSLVSFYSYSLQGNPYNNADNIYYIGGGTVTPDGLYISAQGVTDGYPLLMYRPHHIDTVGNTVDFTVSSEVSSTTRRVETGKPLVIVGDYIYKQSTTTGITDQGIYKFDKNTLSFIETIPYPDISGFNPNYYDLIMDTDDGILKIKDHQFGDRVYAYYNSQWIIVNDNYSMNDPVNYIAWWKNNTVYTVGNSVYAGPDSVADRITQSVVSDSSLTNSEPVAAILSALMGRSYLDEDEYLINAESLSDKIVRSLSIGQLSTTRSVLEQLQSAYLFDIHSSDKIYIKARDYTSIVTVPYEDLAFGSPNEEPFSLNTSNELEVPSQISLSYINVNADHSTSTEFSDRLISSQESLSNIQLALGMTPTEAKKSANAILLDQISSLTGTTIKLPIRYSFVEPNDIITVMNEDGTRGYKLKVVAKKDTNGVLEVGCILAENSVIEYEAVTDDQDQSVQLPATIANTSWKSLDIPLLRDADDSYGYYVTMSRGTGDQWSGGVYARSWDDVSYSQIGFTNQSSVVGQTLTSLGNFTEGNLIDEYNIVRVSVNSELSSTTREGLFGNFNTNTALIGFEIIRFRDAVLVSTGVYDLVGLIRGQRGTEWAINTHSVGERFVILNSTNVIKVAGQLSYLNVPSYVKAVTSGKLISSVSSESFTDTGILLKPFNPINLRVLKQDNGDMYTTWTRRTRLTVNYFGSTGGSYPMGEAIEKYRIKVYNGSNILIRTEDTTSPFFNYTSDKQSEDGLTTGNPFVIKVMQLSDRVGEGYATQYQGVI